MTFFSSLPCEGFLTPGKELNEKCLGAYISQHLDVCLNGELCRMPLRPQGQRLTLEGGFLSQMEFSKHCPVMCRHTELKLDFAERGWHPADRRASAEVSNAQ